MQIVRIGLRHAVAAIVQEDQLFGPLHRQRAQQEVIERAEGGSVGADRQCEGRDGDSGESGSLGKAAEGQREVLNHKKLYGTGNEAVQYKTEGIQTDAGASYGPMAMRFIILTVRHPAL